MDCPNINGTVNKYLKEEEIIPASDKSMYSNEKLKESNMGETLSFMMHWF